MVFRSRILVHYTAKHFWACFDENSSNEVVFFDVFFLVLCEWMLSNIVADSIIIS